MKNEYNTDVLIKNMTAYKKLLEKYNKKRKQVDTDGEPDKTGLSDLKIMKRKLSTSDKE